MSEILLLRHGKSDWSVDTDDFHRPLTNRGKRSAQRIGHWLQTHDLFPEHVISSPATRAWLTAEKTVKAMGLMTTVIESEPRLYEADLSTLIELVANLNQRPGLTMLVGHNPGFEELLCYLSNETLAEAAEGKLMPTATLAHLELPNKPDAVLKHKAAVRALVYARNLPKQFAVRTEKGTEYRDRPAYYYTQSGVIPYRIVDGQLQILLISTSNGKNWTLPKGIVEPGLSPMESAAKEAYEEAGIQGQIDAIPCGYYYQDKWGGQCQITLYLMQVQEQLSDTQWHDPKRKRRWFKAKQAAKHVANSKLSDLISMTVRHLEQEK